jgi:PST family polysaccharide transporter
MMLGMMAVSRYFVLSVFGEQWLPVSTLVTILAPIGLVQSIDATTGSLYQAKGRTDWLLRWGVFSGVIAVAALVLGLKWGILGVVIGYLVETVIWTYPGLAIPLKLIEMRVKTLMRGLYRPLLCSVLMVLAVEFFDFLLQNRLGVHVTFVVLFSLGILAYAIFSMLLNREGIARLLAIVKP